jgi:outer membrane protein assembly factor BamB
LYTLDGSSGIWYYYSNLNFLIQADICSVPIPERTCTPGESWPTSGHDFRRTAASLNSTPDAQCKQALMWWHNDAAGIAYSRPIIYDTVLLIAYNNKLQAFSINGNPTTPMWSISALPYMGSSFRNSVTVKDGFVYFGGGSNKGFAKANVYTGAIIWSRNPLNLPLADNTTYTRSVILTQGTDEVVYLTADGGQVYALNASDGLNYAGWLTNPVVLDGNPFHTLSCDPSRNVLYVGTDGTLNVNGYGTVYAINAATGAIVWQDGMGVLQGVAFDSTGTTEEFRSPLAVDADGAIYAVSSFTVEAKAGTPSGVKYRFNPDGTIAWARGFKFGYFGGPVIDANAVYMTARRAWTSETTRIEATKKNHRRSYLELRSLL